jgi:hypothetical protein
LASFVRLPCAIIGFGGSHGRDEGAIVGSDGSLERDEGAIVGDEGAIVSNEGTSGRDKPAFAAFPRSSVTNNSTSVTNETRSQSAKARL